MGIQRVPRLILASSSPQRQHLLAKLGFEFSVVAPSDRAECGVCSQETPPEFASRMAYQKAADVVSRVSDGIVIACDTVVECVGQILGKPKNISHARQMLELLSGRIHHVYSGLCLWECPGGQPHVRVAITRLQFDPISKAQLEEYLASGQWEGKAGAFGYQDRVGWLHILEGSESNVIGLPTELLEEMLLQLPMSNIHGEQ